MAAGEKTWEVPRREKASETQGLKTPLDKTVFPVGALLSSLTPGPGRKNNTILSCAFS